MSTSTTPPPTGSNKADPDTMALRASPRPVTRLNRRMLAVLAGTLGTVVLGGTLWSLQSHKRERNAATELYNVDRVSHAENLDQLPKRLSALGVQYPKENEEQLGRDLRDLYYRYHGAKLTEIDPMQVIRESFQLIYANNIRLPSRFVLLDKAIATVGSVGVELYADFNVFEVARPYARSLVLGRFTPERVAGMVRSVVFGLARVLREAPYQLHDFLEQAREGRIEVGFVHKGLEVFICA